MVLSNIVLSNLSNYILLAGANIPLIVYGTIIEIGIVTPAIIYTKMKGESFATSFGFRKQFEYNTYIRDFSEDNKGKSLEEAINCWKYKKSLPGHNRYEKSDLAILNK